MGSCLPPPVLVVCAVCLLDVKQHLHIRVGQIEIDLDCGFAKPCLNFVYLLTPSVQGFLSVLNCNIPIMFPTQEEFCSLYFRPNWIKFKVKKRL